ncbi:MAG: peptidoglycan DD-metalloendopeptidase family protein [Azoarcus sp.]|jgi:murein DD-endopeptidase MepM/ murein hydrolase activator NlpD|nr:peptidoglycan DD-metalloendopeptidase family protein [Azoarcus sp.]
MRIRKNRILAELRWRLGDLRWRLAEQPRRATEVQWRVGGGLSGKVAADLRWHAGNLRWRMEKPRKRMIVLLRSLAELPWRLFENRRAWIAAGFTGVSVLGGVAATAVVAPEEPAGVHTIVENLPVAAQELPAPNLPFIYEDRIGPGDTLQAVFRRLGISEQDALTLLDNKGSARALRELQPGDTFTAVVDATGHLLSLRLPRASGNDLTVARHSIEAPFQVSTAPSVALASGTEMRSGVIKHSLFTATEEAGLPDSVATQLADLFGNQIDFHSGLRQDDTFSVIYETFYHRGAPAHAGRILAAEFVNQGKRHTVFRHTSSDGRSAYYTSEGKSLKRSFLRSPLEYTRVTSSFGRRLHPVHGNWLNHNGVDFGAPTGTPVRATSDGEVVYVGWQSGYGKIVVLQHHDGITTAYAHLNAFAPGLRVGNTVEQGEFIARVGATGRVTGPHLHYEFRVNEVAQNPMTVTLPDAAPLNGRELTRFRQNTGVLLERLALLNYRVASAKNAGGRL